MEGTASRHRSQRAVSARAVRRAMTQGGRATVRNDLASLSLLGLPRFLESRRPSGRGQSPSLRARGQYGDVGLLNPGDRNGWLACGILALNTQAIQARHRERQPWENGGRRLASLIMS